MPLGGPPSNSGGWFAGPVGMRDTGPVDVTTGVTVGDPAGPDTGGPARGMHGGSRSVNHFVWKRSPLGC